MAQAVSNEEETRGRKSRWTVALRCSCGAVLYVYNSEVEVIFEEEKRAFGKLCQTVFGTQFQNLTFE